MGRMSMRKSRRQARASLTPIALFLAALASGAAGCKPAAQAPPERVTIAYATLPNSALLAVAWQKGYFTEEGLEAVPQPHPFGKIAMEALIAGKADFATSADIPVLFAVLKGEPIAPVGVIQTSSKNEAIVALKSRGISTLADLRGKRIGMTPGTNGEYLLDAYLTAQLIRRDEVTAVPLAPDAMIGALRAGAVDAISTWNPIVAEARKAFGADAVTLADTRLYTELFFLSTQRAFASSRPEAVRKVLRALLKAEGFIAGNRAESVALAADFLKLDPVSLGEIWDDFEFRLTLGQEVVVTLENEARWAIKRGLTPATAVPNFLDRIYLDGLATVKPEAVTILR